MSWKEFAWVFVGIFCCGLVVLILVVLVSQP